ncbi:hypothetical protein Acy02nite_75180 [Actinoplanes cyaneus]|uniref:Uncharacterized protein n=1 Tax=Actinoplanes cyaneus TaxID=52696 RepID=A0A919M8A9_9ACTN|nr:hypothetical protein [Actinoplanes cyaneus]MCW2142931.1 hypothetical protein [Actinoplanes cyaneus]GID69637.1 hypothetical protein Acy02nite_75180 [Actinoplanes cyaneus]
MTTDDDTELARLLHQHVLDVLDWLAGEHDADYPQVDSDALALFHGAVLPLDAVTLPAAAGLFTDLSWWLDSCDDEDLDPDTAVKLLEGNAEVITSLSAEQRERLLNVIDELATAEPHPVRRYQFQFFPYAFGLLDDGEEPDLDEPESLEWVPPEERDTIR